jgi:Putative DNA-binding domain
MLWRPFNRPWADITKQDLQDLIDEQIEEQLFVEYKSEWSTRQITKSIDAFANTEGGTLVVGMRTEGRVPVELVGVEHEGDLAESLDRLVRDSIAPLPDYRAKVIRKEHGRGCLVVEVPRGEARPYLVTTTGQVMRRTQTGTEPATRDYLDRLFAEGRAGEEWARSYVDEELRDVIAEAEQTRIWTIPVVNQGLSVADRLFTADVWMLLPELASRFTGDPYGKDRAAIDVTDSHLRITMPGFNEREAFYLQASSDGVIKTTWMEVDGSSAMLDSMIDRALPMHRQLTVERFGFHGRILVVLRNSWTVRSSDGVSRSHKISTTYPDFVLADDLTDSDLVAKLRRHIARSLGRWEAEPMGQSSAG